MFPSDKELVDFYAESLRGSLFSGFLTLTGFLFSMKAFLLANLHRDIYSTKSYHEWIATARKYRSGLKATGSIRRLSRLLLITIIATFVASMSQLTLGLLKHGWAVMVCLSLAGIATVMVGCSIAALSTVVKDWMDYVDHEAEKVKAPATPPPRTS